MTQTPTDQLNLKCNAHLTGNYHGNINDLTRENWN
jgi:hypothetical protein